jgi:PleD family two-component response regulator
MEFISNNYQWIFSGIGVSMVGWLILFLFNRKKKETPNTLTSTNSNSNNITINNSVGNSTKESDSGVSTNQKQQQTKASCNILFIDDKHTEFNIVSILKRAGWVSTKAVKDLSDLDDYKVLEANIIFVDINGVGTRMFEDQGLGLAAALKEKHPNKTVILYSADPTGDRFNKKLKIVDDSLPKNAEPYEFISLIEQYSQK